MPRISSLFALLSAFALFAACSASKDDSRNGKDGYSGGDKPLALNAAPPGLCDGDGSQKECSKPEGCEGPNGSGAAGPISGSGGGYGGGGAVAGSGGSVATGGSAGAATGGSGGGQIADAGTDGCVPDPDGGITCDDAGADAGASAQKLLPQSTASCSSLSNTTPATLYQSADDSNSTASPVIARRLIENGMPVPASTVRTWEFLNYYDFSFEPAEEGGVRIVPQLSSCPKNGELSLQVALSAEHKNPDARRALNITFVLDTSGSMGNNYGYGGPSPIELEKAAVLTIAGQLRSGDIVSMVTWSTVQAELLSGHVVTGPNDTTLVGVAQSLAANGGTDLHAGLVAGYTLAEKNYSEDRINRVVLISDGMANVGIVDEELIGKYADDEEGSDGIYLSGIGVGDGVNDTLMNTVTDAGRGAYLYLDSVAEADKMLGQRFLSVVDLAARAVRLEVNLPWYMQVQKFYGEQISTDPTKVRPQHLGPNDAMLFFQVLSACDASLIHGDDRIKLRATWETPFTREPREAIVDTTFNALAGNDDDLTKAAAITSYAEALTAVDSLGDPSQKKARLDAALKNVLAAKGAGSDPDLVEIAGLLQKYSAAQ